MKCRRCGEEFVQCDDYPICVMCWSDFIQPFLAPPGEPMGEEAPHKHARIQYERHPNMAGLECPRELQPFKEHKR